MSKMQFFAKNLNKYSDNDLEYKLLQRRKLIASHMFDEKSNPLFLNASESEDTALDILFRERFENIENNIIFIIKSFHDDKVNAIKSFRKIISLDLAYSIMSLYVYAKEPFSTMLPVSFPFFYCDQNGKEKKLEERIKDIKIKDNIYIGCPYQDDKWQYHINRNTELDPNQFSKAYPYYYPEFNLIFQGSGNKHRTAEAFLNRNNSILRVIQFNDAPLFNHVKTDGAFWINKHTNIRFQRTFDFRLALIYKLKECEKNPSLL